MSEEQTAEIRIVITGELNLEDGDETSYQHMIDIARQAGEMLVENAALDVFRIELEMPDGTLEIWDAASRAGIARDNEAVDAPDGAPPEPREDSGDVPDHDRRDADDDGA